MIEFELVVPAFNEAKNLPLILSETIKAAIEAGFTPDTFQLVIVNNGSSDDSKEVLEREKSKPNARFFRVVHLDKNKGYGQGVYSGLNSTTAPFIGWTHADMQCHPRDAFRALKVLQSKGGTNFLIKGFRSGRSRKDRFVTNVFELSARVILKIKEKEINAQPKIFSRTLLEELENPPADFSFDVYVVYQAIRNGYKIRTIPVFFPPRIHGTSKWASHFFSRYKTIYKVLREMVRMSLETRSTNQ